MIDTNFFYNSVKGFDEKEKRTNFFKIASNLVKNGFEVEGYLLILTTWNFAKFRYVMKTFDIQNFIDVIKNLNVYYNKLADKDLMTIDLYEFKLDIQTIYKTLSEVEGIEYTGAPKLMHLKNPKLFVMWDAYIRGEKPMKYYKMLQIREKMHWEYKKYGTSPDDYFEFLKDMRDNFINIDLKNSEKPLAKLIDEFNYINITLPIQSWQKEIKQKNKENRINKILAK